MYWTKLGPLLVSWMVLFKYQQNTLAECNETSLVLLRNSSLDHFMYVINASKCIIPAKWTCVDSSYATSNCCSGHPALAPQLPIRKIWGIYDQSKLTNLVANHLNINTNDTSKWKIQIMWTAVLQLPWSAKSSIQKLGWTVRPCGIDCAKLSRTNVWEEKFNSIPNAKIPTSIYK